MASVSDNVVLWALAQLGAHGWKNGASFVHDGYKTCGIEIPTTAIGQGLRLGEVPAGFLAKGDIVLPTARLSQLYIGGNRVIGITRRHRVAMGSIGRIWRIVRVTTPGGGHGLTLAVPGYTPPKIGV